eukprot:PhM_4_TR18056/c0_g1_i2/m.41045
MTMLQDDYHMFTEILKTLSTLTAGTEDNKNNTNHQNLVENKSEVTQVFTLQISQFEFAAILSPPQQQKQGKLVILVSSADIEVMSETVELETDIPVAVQIPSFSIRSSRSEQDQQQQLQLLAVHGVIVQKNASINIKTIEITAQPLRHYAAIETEISSALSTSTNSPSEVRRTDATTVTTPSSTIPVSIVVQHISVVPSSIFFDGASTPRLDIANVFVSRELNFGCSRIVLRVESDDSTHECVSISISDISASYAQAPTIIANLPYFLVQVDADATHRWWKTHERSISSFIEMPPSSEKHVHQKRTAPNSFIAIEFTVNSFTIIIDKVACFMPKVLFGEMLQTEDDMEARASVRVLRDINKPLKIVSSPTKASHCLLSVEFDLLVSVDALHTTTESTETILSVALHNVVELIKSSDGYSVINTVRHFIIDPSIYVTHGFGLELTDELCIEIPSVSRILSKVLFRTFPTVALTHTLSSDEYQHHHHNHTTSRPVKIVTYTPRNLAETGNEFCRIAEAPETMMRAAINLDGTLHVNITSQVVSLIKSLAAPTPVNEVSESVNEGTGEEMEDRTNRTTSTSKSEQLVNFSFYLYRFNLR